MLFVNFTRKGLLFSKLPDVDDPQNFMATLLDGFKDSLALTLDHFYPHAGHLVTKKEDSSPSYMVFADCNDSPGAQFIYAAADMTISNILSSIYVPQILQSFFDHDRVINHDGHTLSLLSIQVTGLVDGIFIGYSTNHSMEPLSGISSTHGLRYS
ncbi:uncharacterized acetyltransferase At3g50280-like [Vitis riparia]|uniref:uncharacterized acetyltransferase At3g50280-like n=1 Tax=Vitis riparia TaxID=96939 RepID=UPI00155B22E2|nr:uncharacterized acetyltransferase At3g50280-like [Vitis riparia]